MMQGPRPARFSGTPVTVLPVSEPIGQQPGELVASLTIREILAFSLSAKEAKLRMGSVARLGKAIELHQEVQRAFKGAKATNAEAYKRYILEAAEGVRAIYELPPVRLFTTTKLEMADEFTAIIPTGLFFVCYDADTQRVALEEAAGEDPAIMEWRRPVIIKHGAESRAGAQLFHDCNSYGVKVNASLAIASDQYDHGSQITRLVLNNVPELRDKVEMEGRQVKGSQWFTLNALRTAVVSQMLGTAGFAVGNGSCYLPDDADRGGLEAETVDFWKGLVADHGGSFSDRDRSLIGAPPVMAALGVLANRHGSKKALEMVRFVDWTRDERWLGVALKTSPSGALSHGGVKEYGHAVVAALEKTETEAGQKIRQKAQGRRVADVALSR
jgi:DNA sulfur modification protein DndB